VPDLAVFHPVLLRAQAYSTIWRAGRVGSRPGPGRQPPEISRPVISDAVDFGHFVHLSDPFLISSGSNTTIL
jgi:hypothetical protein